LHLPRPVVDECERPVASRGREDEVPLGSCDDPVHTRKACDLLDDALALEIERYERTVAEVGDVEASAGDVDGLVVEARRVAGKGDVGDRLEREGGCRGLRARSEKRERE
jgi:hypothetical protein